MPTVSIERMSLGPAQNFVYLLVPVTPGRLAVVDPAWEPDALLQRAEALGRPITDIVLTHHHQDHTNAVAALLARHPARVHVQRTEQPFLRGQPWQLDLVCHKPDDTLELGGDAKVQLLHTPGHTPGSQCLLVGNDLLTGDTLFVDGCGRCDLPGGDPRQLFESLQALVRRLPGTTRILPGHNYGPAPESILADQRRTNPYLEALTIDEFVTYRMRLRPEAVPLA